MDAIFNRTSVRKYKKESRHHQHVWVDINQIV